MAHINRGVVVVRPKQACVDWINSWDPENKLSLLDTQDDCTAYLIPTWDDDEEFVELLGELYATIFERELEGWCLDESLWPERRDFEVFCEWFVIERQSVALDLGKGDIEHDV